MKKKVLFVCEIVVIWVLMTLLYGCVVKYRLVRYEQVGPVRAEIWKKPDGTCERRVYLDSLYYKTEVPCQ